MPSKKNTVNLDALIIREDFEAQATVSQTAQQNFPTFAPLNFFDPSGPFYPTLRKPDFQRETASWEPEKVADFIQSFVYGDLIPAVIIWRSKGNNFVIDGCHRVSALIAWLLDDYGDEAKSNAFYKYRVGKDQKIAGDKTRKLVKALVGSYKEMMQAVSQPETARSHEFLQLSREIVTRPLTLQWIANKEPNVAEKSFFTINQAGTAIEPSELQILKLRTTPNALAARAIVRAGTGHKYWQRFGEEKSKGIETIAGNIYETLFSPEFETPIRTLDLPVAGKGYSGLPLLYDSVNIISPVPQGKWVDIPGSKKGESNRRPMKTGPLRLSA